MENMNLFGQYRPGNWQWNSTPWVKFYKYGLSGVEESRKNTGIGKTNLGIEKACFKVAGI